MKTENTCRLTRTAVLSATAAALLTSCVTYSHISTYISPDLSVERTVATEADESYFNGQNDESPFFFETEGPWSVSRLGKVYQMDFHDQTRTMNIAAAAHFPTLSDAAFSPTDPDMEDSPMLRPEENISKKYRWFFTEYRYTARYSRIDSLPVPLSEFLTREEQEIFFSQAKAPEGWNGIELYCRLDGLNSRYIAWYIMSTGKVSRDIITPYCDSSMLAAMDMKFMDFMSEEMKKSELDKVTPERLCTGIDSLSGSSSFMELYGRIHGEADPEYERRTSVMKYFDLSFISDIHLPGKTVSTNAPETHDGAPRWKIDCYRLLYDGMTLTATSRKADWTGISVTFIITAAAIFAGARLVRRKRRI